MTNTTDLQTLIPGLVYDVRAISLIGWTEGDGTSTEGYNYHYYFDGDGRYLGPDAHGIEPIVTIAAD